ncbi:MAG: hypothetical protein M1831_004960 [Alyxoria varia]|nr:MAG: hypothetical protein M1831_004960 [Alyxoria varia]
MGRAPALVAATAIVLFFIICSQLQNEFRPLGSSLSILKQAIRHGCTSHYAPHLNHNSGDYVLGVGKADITGPVVEIDFMGYANTSQLGTGLRQRLFSRAFIIGDPEKPRERVVYLVLDTQSGDTAIRYGILQGLKDMGQEYAEYGSNNVAVTGTHSHSGPGAWLNYLLPQITTRGFDKQSYQAIVDGTLLSIRRAHESLALGRLVFGSTRLNDANINRSQFAYLANPEEERAHHKDSVEKELTLLNFQRARDGKSMGVLTWFPTHGTSMYGNNTLVTGDNKGVAAYLLEKSMRLGNDSVTENFVAGFSQANVGDTSPNVLGAYCEDGSGKQCSFKASLCGGKNEPCHGRGPHFNLNDGGARSCYEIGKRQSDAAQSLLQSMLSSDDSNSSVILGPIRSLHTFKDLSNYTFEHPNGTIVTTCPAALGYGFAAGTTDGPGAFDFKQNSSGDANASPVWAAVRDSLHKPGPEQKACQAPKPILLDVGETSQPYQWAPNIVDVQTLRIGQLFVIVSSGEATTMSGRRWRQAVQSRALELRMTTENPIVVLGGPANTYTHYIATEEEYDVQRYEGASTLYGPHTLNAHIDLTKKTMPYLATKRGENNTEAGPVPPININNSLSFITPVVYDSPGFFRSFGDVVSDVNHQYSPGQLVSATFVGANPRSNLRLEGTFASVQRIGDRTNGQTTTVATDEDWELIYRWRRTNGVTGTSEVTLTWEIPEDTRSGLYRFLYNGDSKTIGSGKISPFNGSSSSFLVA